MTGHPGMLYSTVSWQVQHTGIVTEMQLIRQESEENMTTEHPQETIMETWNYKGIKVDFAEWKETIWCGKIGYAAYNKEEPDVEKILSGFFAANAAEPAADRCEEDWDVCMSLNYLSGERPRGVMFGFLAGTENQPAGYDVLKLPPAFYLRLRICGETSAALGHQPWKGGVPPYGWITEEIAPQLGFAGTDAFPVFEYYGSYDPEKGEHKYCYLYVPVIKI